MLAWECYKGTAKNLYFQGWFYHESCAGVKTIHGNATGSEEAYLDLLEDEEDDEEDRRRDFFFFLDREELKKNCQDFKSRIIT